MTLTITLHLSHFIAVTEPHGVLLSPQRMRHGSKTIYLSYGGATGAVPAGNSPRALAYHTHRTATLCVCDELMRALNYNNTATGSSA
eukprot:6181682-Pleurochrysis_carterae.AAC.1